MTCVLGAILILAVGILEAAFPETGTYFSPGALVWGQVVRPRFLILSAPALPPRLPGVACEAPFQHPMGSHQTSADLPERRESTAHLSEVPLLSESPVIPRKQPNQHLGLRSSPGSVPWLGPAYWSLPSF